MIQVQTQPPWHPPQRSPREIGPTNRLQRCLQTQPFQLVDTRSRRRSAGGGSSLHSWARRTALQDYSGVIHPRSSARHPRAVRALHIFARLSRGLLLLAAAEAYTLVLSHHQPSPWLCPATRRAPSRHPIPHSDMRRSFRPLTPTGSFPWQLCSEQILT